MGNCYYNTETCIQYYNKGIENAKKCSCYYMQVKINIKKAKNYLSIGKYELAQNILNEAEEISKKLDQKNLNYISEEINKLSDAISKEINKAKKKCILNFLE